MCYAVAEQNRFVTCRNQLINTKSDNAQRQFLGASEYTCHIGIVAVELAIFHGSCLR